MVILATVNPLIIAYVNTVAINFKTVTVTKISKGRSFENGDGGVEKTHFDYSCTQGA